MRRRVILTNPVRTTIQPVGWKRPTGNRDFRVTQPYGCTGFAAEKPFGTCAHFHRGIDISDGRCGSDILAAASGVIRYAGRLGDGNLSVAILHGSSTYTTYGHLASKIVTKGQKVVAGQKIGTCGASGNANGCHLHFGVKLNVDPTKSVIFSDGNGTRVDPWPMLAQNVTVRAKPDDGINIRTLPTLGSATRYAVTRAGVIERLSDGASLGPAATMRKWGGIAVGDAYTVDGVSSNSWERIMIDGAYRYIASLLAVRSQY